MKPIHYAKPQIIIHWLMFTLILFVIASVEMREFFGKGSGIRAELKDIHIWLGELVFVLLLFRVAIRTGFAQPAPMGSDQQQIFLMKSVHLLMYFLMLTIPLTGILLLQASGKDSSILGFAIPELVSPSRGLKKAIKSIHEVLSNSFYVLIALHVSAALWHHYILKDDTFVRIGWIKRR